MDFLNPDSKKRAAIRAAFDKEFPELQRTRLAKSILGEDIDMYKIGRGERKILFVGTHHGSEHITASLLYYFLFRIASSGERICAFDKRLYLDTFSLYVVPMLNPDGAELSINGPFENPLSERQRRMVGESGDFRRWQANARGVDLNHNYAAGFAEYKKIEAERGIFAGRSLYSGEYPESEPESQAAASLARTLDFSAIVSLHSQGEVIYHYRIDKSAAPVTHLQKALGYSPDTPNDTARFGGFCDYTAGELLIPSITIEVGKGENPLPESEYHRIKERIFYALVGFGASL